MESGAWSHFLPGAMTQVLLTEPQPGFVVTESPSSAAPLRAQTVAAAHLRRGRARCCVPQSWGHLISGTPALSPAPGTHPSLGGKRWLLSLRTQTLGGRGGRTPPLPLQPGHGPPRDGCQEPIHPHQHPPGSPAARRGAAVRGGRLVLILGDSASAHSNLHPRASSSPAAH